MSNPLGYLNAIQNNPLMPKDVWRGQDISHFVSSTSSTSSTSSNVFMKAWVYMLHPATNYAPRLQLHEIADRDSFARWIGDIMILSPDAFIKVLYQEPHPNYFAASMMDIDNQQPRLESPFKVMRGDDVLFELTDPELVAKVAAGMMTAEVDEGSMTPQTYTNRFFHDRKMTDLERQLQDKIRYIEKDMEARIEIQRRQNSFIEDPMSNPRYGDLFDYKRKSRQMEEEIQRLRDRMKEMDKTIGVSGSLLDRLRKNFNL